MQTDVPKSTRNELLKDAAEIVEAALPGYYGSVQFNFQDGQAVNANVNESVKFKPERQEST